MFKKRKPAPNAATPPATAAKPRRRFRAKTIALWVLGLFVAFILFGFFAAPPLIKNYLINQASEQLGRKVSVGKVRVNPFTLVVEVENLLVNEPKSSARFVAFDKLRLDVEMTSLFRRAPVLREITLTSPYVSIIRLDGERYNFSDLIDKFAPPTPPKPAKKEEEAPARFSLNNIRLSNGAIDFDDRPKKTKHAVREMQVAIPFISNLPNKIEIFTEPSFYAKANGTPIELRGKSKPFSANRETGVNLVFTDLNLPHYLEYVPFKLRYKPISAVLAADLDIVFSQPPNQTPQLTVSGQTALTNFGIRELSDAPLLSFPKLTITADRLDVFASSFSIKQIALEQPKINVRRSKDGALNVMVLATVDNGGKELKEIREEERARTNNKTSATKPPQIKVNEIVVSNATVDFADEGPSTPFKMQLNPLKIVAKNFSTLPGSTMDVELQARTDAAEEIAAKATYGFVEGTVQGTAELKKAAIKRYAPYYADALLFDVLDGTADVATGFKLAMKSGQTLITTNDTALDVNTLRLRKRGEKEDFFTLQSLAMKKGEIDLNAHTVTLGELTSRKGRLRALRAKDGAINLASLTPSADSKATAATPPPSSSPSSGPARSAAVPSDTLQTASPWVVTLNKIVIEDYGVNFEDAVPSENVVTTIEPIKLDVENLIIGKPAKAKVKLALKVNRTGQLTAAGTASPDPVDADLKLSVKQLEILPFQPYFADQINIALTSGSVAADGKLSLSVPKSGKTQVAYSGSASVNTLASVDKVNAEDFLKWESLFFDNLRVKLDPFFLEVKEVALTDFYSRLIVNNDGTLNVQGIMVKPGETPGAQPADANAAASKLDAKASEAKAESKPPVNKDKTAKPAAPKPAPATDSTAEVRRFVKIDQVTLQAGTINFSDKFIKPNVTATLNEVGGRVTGLLSDAASRADVDLRGKLSNQAPLTITGQINPLSGDLFADLKVSFRDIELPPFTPYSGKYAGYTIEKGKLSLDLKYLVDKRKLSAENKVFIDQFTFGEKVESADATKLPVQLAVSLLKDREGKINLDIPITGSLDDPKFRLGRVILQVIVNLIVKAVTAPFALIGSLMGGGSGEELSYLEFAYGSAALDENGNKKLETLAKALRDRPGLKLEVIGHADPEKDREGLRQASFDRRLKAQKLKDLTKKGQAAPSVDSITIEKTEYELYLTKAYKQEKFPKPRNFIGLEKDLPVPEMEKLMMTNLVVSDDDMRQLAVQRAQVVKDFLGKAPDIAPDRIFQVEAKSLKPEAKENQKLSRVDFVLK